MRYMTVKKVICSLVVLGIGMTASLSVQAGKLVNHFDQPADLADLNQHRNLSIETARKAIGTGSVAVDTLKRNGFSVRLPDDATQGVLTFWVFDPIFAGEAFFIPSVVVGCEKIEDGKNRYGSFSLFMVASNWQLHDSRKIAGGDEHGRDLYYPRHGGWTRIDVVAPRGEGAKQFDIYIDGRFITKTVEKYTKLKSAGVRAVWGGGTMYFDELSFDSDLSSFKPNAVQDICFQDDKKRVQLTAGQELKATLKLDKRGAFTPTGIIDLELLDGAEKTVASKQVKVDWSQLKDGQLAVALPTPPCSGRYWVKATYQDRGVADPIAAVERCDVQFYLKDEGKQKAILLEGDWDFLPVGERAHPREAIATPAPPKEPPTDWSKAIPLQGVWYQYGLRAREFGYQCAWYHRQVNIPANWGGQKIIMDIEDVQTKAAVYLNAKKVGDIAWPGGALDISNAVKPGQKADLTIYVRADLMAGYNQVMRDILGDAFTPKGNLGMRGLRGRVSLISLPKGPIVDHCNIYTSTTNNSIKFRYQLSNLKPGQKYTISSVIAAAGKPAHQVSDKTFTASGSSQSVTVESSWKNPKLWDIRQPFFYDLNAKLSSDGKVLDVAAPERFGFRELSFKGNRVTLNGRNINLFQPMLRHFFMNPGMSDYMERMNYNSFLASHYNYAVKLGSGGSGIRDYADGTSEMGLGGGLALGVAKNTKVLVAYNKENDPRFWNYYRQVVSYVVNRYGNDPGVFFWSSCGGGNILGMGAMYNPYLQDGLWLRDTSGNQQLARHTQVERREQNVIREMDPSRPLIAQDSGNFNDVSHITQYAGMTPIQELIEMNSYWRKYGTKPIFYSEHAAPYISNWTSHPRNGGHGCKKIIPYFHEWCSITNGDEAFTRTALDNDFLQKYEEHAKGIYEKIFEIKDDAQRKQALAKYSNRQNPPSPYTLYDGKKNARNDLWLKRIRENYLNLRADGIGEICPWTGGLNEKDFTRWFEPVLAFISGPAEDRYDKTHIYAPGDILERGITIVSNDAASRRVQYDWELVIDGKEVGKQSATVTVPPGETIHVPIRVPIVTTRDASGTLTMALSDADSKQKLCSDSVPIDILSPRHFSTPGKIALIDPEGDSAKALERAGIKFQLVPMTMDLSPFDVIIFGRRAFLYELANTPEGFNLAALTRAGKKVLVLEQAEKTLRDRFKFRTEYISPRVVYGREFRGALLDGLPDSCLRFWRGNATLTNGYDVARSQLSPRSSEMNGGRWFYEWNDGKEHTRPMKWGNHHNVATVVIVKPDTGAFRTLIDCEFALNYAAAWQLDNASGQVVFSQLDVSGRTATGPEAERYLQNLVKYTCNLKKRNWKQAVYVGGPKGAELLNSLFVPFKQVSDPAAANSTQHVLILGSAKPEQLKEWKTALNKFVKEGGTVFSLAKNEKELAAGWLPVKVNPEKKMVNLTAVGKSKAALLAGLGNSDFFWRGNIEIVSPGKLPGASVQSGSGVLTQLPEGKGSWVLCQVTPKQFGRDEYFWLKDSRHNTERMIRTLLLNIGVEMNSPYLVQPPKATKEILMTVKLAGTWQCAKADGSTPQTCPLQKAKGWKNMSVPGDFRKVLPAVNSRNGAVWYRRSFTVSQPIPAGAQIKLFFGGIQGIDFTFVNGKQVGNTNRITNPNDLSTATREYMIPGDLLKQGRNEVAILCDFDTNNGLSPGDGTITPPVYLEVFRDKAGKSVPKPIVLDGWWQGIALKKGESKLPADNDKYWHRIKLPGNYQQQHGHWGTHLGYFWVKRDFVLPEAVPAGATPMILLGAVDDEDATYINGKCVGKINKETNPQNYWAADRSYPIPKGVLKVGKNTITVQINNTFMNGGIGGPIKLVFEDPKEVERRKLTLSPYLHQVDKTDDPYMYQGW